MSSNSCHLSLPPNILYESRKMEYTVILPNFGSPCDYIKLYLSLVHIHITKAHEFHSKCITSPIFPPTPTVPIWMLYSVSRFHEWRDQMAMGLAQVCEWFENAFNKFFIVLDFFIALLLHHNLIWNKRIVSFYICPSKHSRFFRPNITSVQCTHLLVYIYFPSCWLVYFFFFFRAYPS